MSTTFKVDNVEPLVNDWTLDKLRMYEGLPFLLRDLGKMETASTMGVPLLRGGKDVHPLMYASKMAFDTHRPLVLSPDMIWVTIVQGLASHIQLDPEKHRSLLVRHQGKKELVVIRRHWPKGDPANPWGNVVGEFVESIFEETDKVDALFGLQFSTSGPTEMAVRDIAIMDSVQDFFSYKFITACGTPSITLEGTYEDWLRVRAGAAAFSIFGLSWWLDKLLPVLDHFVKAVEGNPDIEHWKQLFVRGGQVGSGDNPLMTGWLSTLFPYVKKGDDLGARNHPFPNSPFKSGPRLEEFPSGLSLVPFIWEDRQTPTHDILTTYNMSFCGGFLGVNQLGDPKEGAALRPHLGWAVIDRDQKEPERPIEKVKTITINAQPEKGGVTPGAYIRDFDIVKSSESLDGFVTRKKMAKGFIFAPYTPKERR